MESIYVSQKDMLEICQDGDKYFLRYPTFNITCPEVIREIPKEAADSYMSGEHTGKELMDWSYAAALDKCRDTRCKKSHGN